MGTEIKDILLWIREILDSECSGEPEWKSSFDIEPIKDIDI